MSISFIFAYPCSPIPLNLPTDSHSHILSIFISSAHGNDEKVRFLILAKFISNFSFVKIYDDNDLSCIIKHRTTIPCYCYILFIFCLSYTKTKSPLLLIIEGFPFWLIVRVIKTYFRIHSPLFIS